MYSPWPPAECYVCAPSSHADLSSVRRGLLQLSSSHVYTDTATGAAPGGAGGDKHSEGLIGSPVTASFAQLKIRMTIFEAACPTNLLCVLDIARA